MLSGRRAIEKSYEDAFKGGSWSNHRGKGGERHAISNNLAWGLGQWSDTKAGPNNTAQELYGNWGAVYERDGDTWKVRMLTYNLAPPLAATATVMPSPTTTPSNP